MIRWLVSLALLAAVGLPAAADDVRFMSMDEVERHLGQPGFAVFDANVPEVWEKNHLPGAVHVTGKKLDGLLPADKQATLLFYCTSPK